MDRTLGKICKHAVFSQHGGFDRVVVRQHRYHHLTVAGAGNVRGLVGAEFNQHAASARRAIENRDIVPRYDEVFRHSRAHVP